MEKDMVSSPCSSSDLSDVELNPNTSNQNSSSGPEQHSEFDSPLETDYNTDDDTSSSSSWTTTSTLTPSNYLSRQRTPTPTLPPIPTPFHVMMESPMLTPHTIPTILYPVTLPALPNEILFQIQAYLGPVPSACLGLMNKRLYSLHRAAYGKVTLDFLYSTIILSPSAFWDSGARLWGGGTRVMTSSLRRYIESWMRDAGWVFDRQKKIFRQGSVVKREEEENEAKLEVKRRDRRHARWQKVIRGG